MFKLDEFIKYLKNNKLEGASQIAIGKLIGKPQGYISMISKGLRPFSAEYLEILKKKYGEEIVMKFYSEDDIVHHNNNESSDNEDMPVTIGNLMKVINMLAKQGLENAEANKQNAEANKIHAEANKKNSSNLEKMINLLEKIVPGDESPERAQEKLEDVV